MTVGEECKVRREIVERFIQLSMNALEEDNLDHLSDLFRQRREAMDCIDRARQKLTRDELHASIKREEAIASRLKSMRKKTLEEMDKLGKTRQAVKKYAFKISPPPQPVYCDIET